MSASDVPSSTPAGWYPDPADSARLRRWDGRNWTDEVVVATGTPAPAPVPEPIPVPSPGVAAGDDAANVTANEQTPANDALPDWATLPGLTLPPDLSAIPGFTSNPGLPVPNFDEPDRALPPQAVSDPAAARVDAARSGATLANSPAPQSRRELRALREMHGDEPSASTEAEQPTLAKAEAAGSGSDEPRVADAASPARTPESVGSQSSSTSTPDVAQPESYAPPPSGAQFSAPPPPGVAYTPPASAQHPPFAFGMVPSSSLASAALRNEGIEHGHPYRSPESIATQTSPTPSARPIPAQAPSASTVGVWLIAVLPLLHFAVLYFVFHTLSQPFIPGTQWGILATPAIFSLLFATLDRRTLLARGHESIPGVVWAIVPPLYLIARAVKIGPQSLIALLVWIVLQAAAVLGVVVLLSDVLAGVFSATA